MRRVLETVALARNGRRSGLKNPRRLKKPQKPRSPCARPRPSAFPRGRAGARTGRRPPRRPPRPPPRPARGTRVGSAQPRARRQNRRRPKPPRARPPTAHPPRAASPPPCATRSSATRRSSPYRTETGSPRRRRAAKRRRVPGFFFFFFFFSTTRGVRARRSGSETTVRGSIGHSRHKRRRVRACVANACVANARVANASRRASRAFVAGQKKTAFINSRVRLDTKRNSFRDGTHLDRGSRFVRPLVPSSCSAGSRVSAPRACSRWPSSGLSSAVSRRSGNARSARVRGQNLRGKYRSASSAVRETKDDESPEPP